MRQVHTGSLETYIKDSSSDEIGELIDNYNFMITKMVILIDEQYKSGKEVKNAELKAERDSLKKYQELQSEYKTKERQSKKDFIELTEVTEQYLTEIEPDTVVLRYYFKRCAKIFYPNSVAGLTI